MKWEVVEENKRLRMAREKIQIRKIHNTTARQVTFSKRRRGLFKKAEELSILCDAEVGVIIFSATGKLLEYSSSSINEVVERRKMHSKNLPEVEQPSLELQLENSHRTMLSKQVAEKSKLLRQMRGEDLQGLTLDELQKLEKTLEAGLSRVLERKGEQIVKEINGLQMKGVKLMEENLRLRQQMKEMSRGDKQIVVDIEPTSYEDGQSSESVTNGCNSTGPQEHDDSSDTSLKLGLPFSTYAEEDARY
eukprot:TRINITY_DN5437_c0_g4_i2.p1 TRINITY_DN5437_c0_g4~~TRINITY_DN5437_c0_g4_i2.p1  ORF type:complete len:248 (-),score=61.91 TRINITY_DN5437_c0_g4_i2:365-1108(-)